MLYIAGLQGIDKTLLEAAEMDSASPFQRFRHITLPLLGPMIRLSVFTIGYRRLLMRDD
jgi:raffinose/stachyose/melibiose transport system permease protein